MDNLSRSSTRQSWFESNPKKTLASVVLISFLLIDFGAAAFLKAIGKFKPAYVTSSVREAYYRIPHPVYHHTLATNIHDYTAEWGGNDYTVNTNSLGFKDFAPREVPLVPSKKRILIIGDSFTEGVGVDYAQTFAGLLQQQYPNIEFLNAAATSYAPIIYYRKIKYFLEEAHLIFNEVWVFIDLSDIEDEALGYTFDKQENVISRNSIGRVGVTTELVTKDNNLSVDNSTRTRSPPKPEMSFKEFLPNTRFFWRSFVPCLLI